MYAVIVLVAVAIVSLLAGQPALASNTPDFQLQIAPQHCTLDTLTTGVSQFTTIQPEACQAAEEAAKQTLESQIQASSNPTATAQPEDSQGPIAGNQGIFENTVFESLASLLGVGDKNGSSAGPVTTSLALLAITGVIIDGAFFGLRFTRPALATLRRVSAAILRFLLPGVSR